MNLQTANYSHGGSLFYASNPTKFNYYLDDRIKNEHFHRTAKYSSPQPLVTLPLALAHLLQWWYNLCHRAASGPERASRGDPVGHLLPRFMTMGRSAFYCFYPDNAGFTKHFYYLLIDSKCLLSIE